MSRQVTTTTPLASVRSVVAVFIRMVFAPNSGGRRFPPAGETADCRVQFTHQEPKLCYGSYRPPARSRLHALRRSLSAVATPGPRRGRAAASSSASFAPRGICRRSMFPLGKCRHCRRFLRGASFLLCAAVSDADASLAGEWPTPCTEHSTGLLAQDSPLRRCASRPRHPNASILSAPPPLAARLSIGSAAICHCDVRTWIKQLCDKRSVEKTRGSNGPLVPSVSRFVSTAWSAGMIWAELNRARRPERCRWNVATRRQTAALRTPLCFWFTPPSCSSADSDFSRRHRQRSRCRPDRHIGLRILGLLGNSSRFHSSRDERKPRRRRLFRFGKLCGRSWHPEALQASL